MFLIGVVIVVLLLEKRIDFYDSEIKKYEREVYFEKHLLKKMLRPKTYKRWLKKKLVDCFRTDTA